MIHFHGFAIIKAFFLSLAIAALVLSATAFGKQFAALGQTTAALPIPPATPAAMIKRIVINGHSEQTASTTQASVTRSGVTAQVTTDLLLYKGDVIENLVNSKTKITVLFLDAPFSERDDEVIIDEDALVGISSIYSWWGTTWVKVKGIFKSRTVYAQMGAGGTEYQLKVFRGEDRATLIVLEGAVDVSKDRFEFVKQILNPAPETLGLRFLTPQFLRASFAPERVAQEQPGHTLDVPVGTVTDFDVTYSIFNECHEKHQFELRASDNTGWFHLDVAPKINIDRGERIPIAAKLTIDARQLSPGQYRANVYGICLDCNPAQGCSKTQLIFPYSINVKRGDDSSPTPTPTPSPSPTLSPSPTTNQVFRVKEGEESPVTTGSDKKRPAPTPDLLSVLDWTTEVIRNTQPSYSAQNLIPYFSTPEQRGQEFADARKRAILANESGSNATLGNIYSDWGQGAWAVFAYTKELDRPGQQTASALRIARGEAYRLTGRLDQAAPLAIDSKLPKALNLLGNIALDQARIALDKTNSQDADNRLEEAKKNYSLALSASTQTPAATLTGNTTIRTNLAEVNIVAGNVALQRNAVPDAKAKYNEAAHSLESMQQAAAAYPFPITDLGVAYQGLGDAAALSRDITAANDAYGRAKRQHEQAITAHRDFAEAYFNLGDLYDDLGDKENAKANYRLAIRSRPEQPAAYYPLAMLLKDDEPQLAAALAATYLQLQPDVFNHGQKAENARKIADRQTVERPARIGEKTKEKPPVTGNTGTDVIIPNVVGKPESQARAELENLRLRVSEKTESDKKQPKDAVIEQDPKAPKQVKPGSTVKLVVSLGDLVEVPEVVKKSEDDARQKITSDNKLTVGKIERRPDCKMVGKVMEQNPLHSKTKVARGTPIDLVIGSLGENPVTIPRFTDRNSSEAFINDNGLTLKRVRTEETDSVAEGTVLRQSPKAGEQYGRNCPVNVDLTVAVPIVYVDVDNYVGKSIDVAQQELRAIELNAQVSYQETADTPAGTVLAQTPMPPAKVRHRSYVNLVVAIPPKIELVPVPPLCKLSLQAARAELFSKGLINTDEDVVDLPPNQPACGAADASTVMWQDPPANTKVPKGSRVKLSLVKILEH